MEPNTIQIQIPELGEISARLKDVEAKISSPTPDVRMAYTEREAAEELRVSLKTVQNLRNAGRIGFVRCPDGRRILYRREHLEAFLNQNEFKPRRK